MSAVPVSATPSTAKPYAPPASVRIEKPMVMRDDTVIGVLLARSGSCSNWPWPSAVS